jgi:hypothetical protein
MNGKGSINGNKTIADMIEYMPSNNSYKITEYKLSPKSKLSKGQRAAQKNVNEGNQYFEVNSNKLKDEYIKVSEYIINYKYK